MKAHAFRVTSLPRVPSFPADRGTSVRRNWDSVNHGKELLYLFSPPIEITDGCFESCSEPIGAVAGILADMDRGSWSRGAGKGSTPGRPESRTVC